MDEAAAVPERIAVGFAGRRWAYFKLSLRTTLLTLLTLGLYRFWMKTQQRRYLWASIRPGGWPLEYLGNPWEKLLGFLMAVTVLAFYLGVINLLLVFGSFMIFKGQTVASYVAFLGFVPLFWAAKYRARRYVVGRTAFRGIRFYAEPGAWAYAGAALWNWVLTLISLGYLMPRMTWVMEKFRTDRTWLGDHRFEQRGDWKALRRYLRPFLVASVLTGGFVWWVYSTGPMMIFLRYQGRALAGFFALMLLWTIAFILYRANTMRVLASHKVLGELRLTSAIRPWRIVRHNLLGGFLASVFVGLVVWATIWITAAVAPEVLTILENPITPDSTDQEIWKAIAVGLVIYFAAFVMWAVLTQVFVSFPNFRHYAETLSYEGEAGLMRVRQREGDDVAHAEGVADALDFGAAF